MPSSIASGRTGSSRGSYRITSKKSNVDETLFGNKKPSSAQGRRNSEIRKVQEEVRTGNVTSINKVSVLPQSEIIRMKHQAVILSKEEQMQQKKILDEQNEKQMAAAKAKRQRMQELEAQKKLEAPLDSTQQEE
mmetsp:Transcript_41346/g.36701  ORF Transcript_41346/g.36701 Transcript_41346/m.36701 type:complete len:134 (+) Transcript_41346:32-433(+)